MKHLVILLMLLCLSIGNTIAGDAVINKDNCTITKDGNTYPLYGRVYLVKEWGNADITAYLVKEWGRADIIVYLTRSSGVASDCGKIYLTRSCGQEDIKVYLVKEWGRADIIVYLTDSWGTAGIR